MDPSGLALFSLAERRLSWIGRRQEMLAQNIANADTPRWQVRDLKPFASLLPETRHSMPAQTDPRHFSGAGSSPSRPTRVHGERAPDGNGVALDVELAKVAETESAHALTTGLYGKYLALFRVAAGR